MSEGVAAYFQDHKESSELGRLALRGGIVSVAMQYGNGALQITAGRFWISRDRHGSDELCINAPVSASTLL
jgi:hypothetical protein